MEDNKKASRHYFWYLKPHIDPCNKESQEQDLEEKERVFWVTINQTGEVKSDKYKASRVTLAGHLYNKVRESIRLINKTVRLSEKRLRQGR